MDWTVWECVHSRAFALLHWHWDTGDISHQWEKSTQSCLELVYRPTACVAMTAQSLWSSLCVMWVCVRESQGNGMFWPWWALVITSAGDGVGAYACVCVCFSCTCVWGMVGVSQSSAPGIPGLVEGGWEECAHRKRLNPVPQALLWCPTSWLPHGRWGLSHFSYCSGDPLWLPAPWKPKCQSRQEPFAASQATPLPDLQAWPSSTLCKKPSLHNSCINVSVIT